MKVVLSIIVLALVLALPARAQVSVSAPAEVPFSLSFMQLKALIITLDIPRMPLDNQILLTVNADGTGDIVLSGTADDPVTEQALTATQVTTITTALGLTAQMASAITSLGPVSVGIYAPQGLLKPCWLEVYTG